MADMGFLRISRTNGEQYFFNMSQIAMIFVNREERLVIITGTGFEKKFQLAEAEQLLVLADSMTISSKVVEAEPAAAVADAAPAA